MTISDARNQFVSRYFPEERVIGDAVHHSQTLEPTGRSQAERQVWGDLINELDALRSLEEDWDGKGAPAPDPGLVDSAIQLACLLRDSQSPPAHFATASVAGTIHLEWVESERSLDVEVIAPGVAEVCRVDLADAPVAPSVFRW